MLTNATISLHVIPVRTWGFWYVLRADVIAKAANDIGGGSGN